MKDSEIQELVKLHGKNALDVALFCEEFDYELIAKLVRMRPITAHIEEVMFKYIEIPYLLRYLHATGAPLTGKMLIHAISHGLYETAEMLVDAGVPISYDGPLNAAVEKKKKDGDWRFIKLLLRNGVQPTRELVSMAAAEANREMVSFLVSLRPLDVDVAADCQGDKFISCALAMLHRQNSEEILAPLPIAAEMSASNCPLLQMTNCKDYGSCPVVAAAASEPELF